MTEKDLTIERATDPRDLVGLALRFAASRPDADLSWVPACDIEETDTEFVLRAAMAGVAKEDIQLEVKDATLILSGTRKGEETSGQWLRRELPVGGFYRAFELSSDVDAERVTAEHKNGLLEVHLPKAEKARARKVEIK